MKRLLILLLSVPWLVGCNPVYTTHLVSSPNSFVTDDRLVGIWDFGSLHIEHDSATDRLYAIRQGENCSVTPIHTTQINGDWFMNIDVTGKFGCVSSARIPINDPLLQEFDQLYHFVKYRIRNIRLDKVLLEDVLPNLDAALQILEETSKEEIIQALDELERQKGVKFEPTDIEGGRVLLARLTTLLNQLVESDDFDDQAPVLEILEIEYMRPDAVENLVADGRLSGVIKKNSNCGDCRTIVITDTGDKAASLVQATAKALFPEQFQVQHDVTTDPFEIIEAQAFVVVDFLFDFGLDRRTFFRLIPDT